MLKAKRILTCINFINKVALVELQGDESDYILESPSGNFFL